MASAAASIIQVETPPSTMPENTQQNQLPTHQAESPGPLSDPNLSDYRQHGRHGWWGRRWRQHAPVAEGTNPGESLPHTTPEHPTYQTTEAGDPQNADSGRQHGDRHFWRHNRRGGNHFPQEGQVQEGDGFMRPGMPGCHGYRYRHFRARCFGRGPEDMYLFREFDFM